MIRHLYRFPVKGLSPETPNALDLLEGEGIEGDRVIAIARDGNRLDLSAPRAMAKTNFLMLAKDEKLARLETRYDAGTGDLAIASRNDGELISVNIGHPEGKAALARFFRDYLGDDSLEPTPVSAPGHKFTDLSVVSPEKMRAVSLINLASVRAFELDLGRPVDHRRFRGNIVYAGKAPWDEFDWLEKTIRIGSATARIVKRTQRCAATEVNPDTGERDIRLPAEMRQRYGHFDMGVYAEIVETGRVQIGDEITLL